MDQKMTRRRLLGTGAALAAAVPLNVIPFPYPAGVGPAPVAADTTTTELTDDDRAWMAKRVTRNEWGQRVVGTEDLTPKHWTFQSSPLHIVSDSDHYHPVFEFLRRSEGHRQAWQMPDAVKARAAWIWSTPEPMRVALMALVEDIASVAEARIHTALSNVLYGHLEGYDGRNSDEAQDDDDWEYQHYTDAEMVEAFRRPTTIGAVLLAISEELREDPRVWLNEHDLALLRQAT